MPTTPHLDEKHFTAGAVVRDLVIGMSDGLTVPFALAAGLAGAVSPNWIIVTAGLAGASHEHDEARPAHSARLDLQSVELASGRNDCFGEAPKPARDARAPKVNCHAVPFIGTMREGAASTRASCVKPAFY